jgi:ubiquinone/menaquinone biosynthesis C-methylase UbiE
VAETGTDPVLHEAGRAQAAAVREEYATLAAEYDRRWSAYLTASTRETLRRLDVRPGERVLDVGCGTGILLASVRRAVPSAPCVGVDLAPAMLHGARHRLGPDACLAAADAGRLPFGPQTFDVVVSTSSFHYWPDPSAGLSELRRVLRPGGRVVITDWCDDYVACRMCDLVLRIAGRAHGRAYGSAACAQLLERSGFTGTVVDRYKISWLWGLMTARAFRPLP